MTRTFCVALTLCAAFATNAASLSELQRSALDELVTRFQTEGGHPAVTLLIEQSGETAYLNASGVAELEHGSALTADSAYAIGSITKSFTALATLLLVERGRIDLNANLGNYLPWYTGPAAAVAVRHLLDHTSGIPNYTDATPDVVEKFQRAATSRDEMVALFADLPLEFVPGAKFSYSNSGYYLLGLIIEAVSGRTYYEFLDAEVFDPLGLHRIYSGDDREIIPGHVRGYDLQEGTLRNAPPWHYLVPFAAGSLVSTAGDLARYRRGVFHHPAFEATKDDVLRQVPLNDGTLNVYTQGGLIVSDADGRRKVSHSGDIWGYSADHAYYPDDDVTIVVLTSRQTEAPSPVALEQKAARVVFGVPQPVTLDLQLPDEELARYEGDYELHPFLFGPPVYGFVAKDGQLFLRFGGREAADSPLIPLRAQGDGAFVMSFDDEWTFQFTQDGASKRFVARVRDGVFPAREIEVARHGR